MVKRNLKKYTQDGNAASKKEHKPKTMCPKCDSFNTEYLGTDQYEYITYKFYNCSNCGCEFDKVITTRFEIINKCSS